MSEELWLEESRIR